MNMYCQDNGNNSKSFVFPFTRQDATWKTFNSSRERIAALQIPSNQLESIGTKELIDICLNFPYIPDILAFDRIKQGFDNLKSKFNGFEELLKRQDLAEKLAEKFENSLTIFQDYDENPGMDCLFTTARYVVLKYITTLDSVQNRLNEQQRDNILSNAERCFLATKHSTTPEFLSPLHCTQSRQMVNVGDTLFGYRMKYVYTPFLTPVFAGVRVFPDYTQNEKDNIRQYVENSYNATVVSDATRKYNCHGYAWHMSDNHANDSVWIGVDSEFDENIYWNDDSYVEVSSGTTSGIRVSYDESTANHSAVVYDGSHYISKWGAYPLVIHEPNEVPYDTSEPKKFYRKRVLSITGNGVLCGSNVYSVSDLPSGTTVAWSISGTTPSCLTLTTNSPSTNQCTITRSGYAEFNYITLCANIVRNGVTLRTLTKKIYRDNFSGTYEEGTSSYNGHDYPAISQTNITNRSATYVYINGTVTLYSDYFVNKDLSTSGPYAYFSHVPENRVRFSLSSSNLSQPFTITIPASGCDDEVRLTFYAITPYLNYNLNIIPRGSQTYELSVTRNVVEGDMEAISETVGRTQEDNSAEKESSRLIDEPWTLEVTNAVSGRNALSREMDEPVYILNTAGWEPGVYVVRAIVGKESLTGKITVN